MAAAAGADAAAVPRAARDAEVVRGAARLARRPRGTDARRGRDRARGRRAARAPRLARDARAARHHRDEARALRGRGRGPRRIIALNSGMEWMQQRWFHELWLQDTEVTKLIAADPPVATTLLGFERRARRGDLAARAAAAARHRAHRDRVREPARSTRGSACSRSRCSARCSVVRARTNTTTAILIHALYDAVRGAVVALTGGATKHALAQRVTTIRCVRVCRTPRAREVHARRHLNGRDRPRGSRRSCVRRALISSSSVRTVRPAVSRITSRIEPRRRAAPAERRRAPRRIGRRRRERDRIAVAAGRDARGRRAQRAVAVHALRVDVVVTAAPVLATRAPRPAPSGTSVTLAGRPLPCRSPRRPWATPDPRCRSRARAGVHVRLHETAVVDPRDHRAARAVGRDRGRTGRPRRRTPLVRRSPSTMPARRARAARRCRAARPRAGPAT